MDLSSRDCPGLYSVEFACVFDRCICTFMRRQLRKYSLQLKKLCEGREMLLETTKQLLEGVKMGLVGLVMS